jgi:hypothetical protein
VQVPILLGQDTVIGIWVPFVSKEHNGPIFKTLTFTDYDIFAFYMHANKCYDLKQRCRLFSICHI